MGRPREHDEATATALLGAAERIVAREGLDALSVRRVADEVGTTTRAVYSLFGSKEGLLVALATRAFELIRTGIVAHPDTDDPAGDLVDAGVTVFRAFAIEHPALFRIGVLRDLPHPQLGPQFAEAARAAFNGLVAKVERLDAAGLLGGRSAADAAVQFHACCEGLTTVELRKTLIPKGEEERMWRDTLGALVAGFAAQPVEVATASKRRSRRKV